MKRKNQDKQRRKLRAAIAKRVSGDAALSRRRKLCFEGGLPRHPARFAPLRLLFPKSSSILFGSPVDLFCLFFPACACLRRPSAQREGDGAASAAPSALPPTCIKTSARITAILEKATNFTKNTAKIYYRTTLKMIQIKERTAAEMLKIMPIRDSRLFVFEFLKISSILLHN